MGCQGPSGPDWLATAAPGFWSGRALATGTVRAGFCLVHQDQPPPPHQATPGSGIGSALGSVSRGCKPRLVCPSSLLHEAKLRRKKGPASWGVCRRRDRGRRQGAHGRRHEESKRRVSRRADGKSEMAVLSHRPNNALVGSWPRPLFHITILVITWLA